MRERGVGLLAMFVVVVSLSVLAVTPPMAAAQEAQGGREVVVQVEPIDVNRASAEDLQRAPGIGPATAQRIIEWREKNGRFERLEDLLNIRGIGEKTLEKLRPYLTVGKVGQGGRR